MRRPPANEAETALLDYLEMMRRLRRDALRPNGFVYDGPEDFLLQHGEWFEPQPLPTGVPHEASKACFNNAFMRACSTRETYVEGYGLAIIPTLHAWNVTAGGLLVDVTWEPVGYAYLGVRFSRATVYAALTKGCSVMENYHNRFRLYRKPFKEMKR